jgi:4-amino-4-deoxy-L-arabinose transferase-like glycosyltransferase
MIAILRLWAPTIMICFAVLVGLAIVIWLRRRPAGLAPKLAWPKWAWYENKIRPWIEHLAKRWSDWSANLTWTHLSLGLGIALGLAVVAQLILAGGLSTVLGICMYAAAGLLFALVITTAGKLPPIEKEEAARLRRNVPRDLLGLSSLLLLAYALPRVDNPGLAGAQNYLTLAAWLLSIACFSTSVLWAVRWRLPAIRSIAGFLRTNKGEVAFVLGLTVLALGLRLIKLDQYPYPALKDESTLGVEATGIAQGKLTNLFVPGWSLDPLLSSVPEAIAIRGLGNTLLAVRITPAIAGALSIVFLYFLARSLFDRLTAMLAALCLLTLPPHLHFSRLGVNNIFTSLWAVLVFWLVYRAVQKGRTVDYWLAGLAGGLSLYSYLGNRLILILAAGLLLVCIFTRRGFWKAHWRQLSVFAMTLAVVAAPFLFYYLHHPELILQRFNDVDIFSSHWLVMEPINSGHSIPTALFEQFSKSVLVFISEGANGGWYYSPLPYLPLLGAVFFVFGLVYSLVHLRELRYLLVQVWFWAIVILGSVLIIVPPSNERIVGALPVAALFTAIGLSQASGLLNKLRLASPRLIDGLAVGLMLLISWQGAHYYLGTYQQERVFNQATEEFEFEVSQYVRTLGLDNRLYLLVELPLESAYFPAHDYLIPEIQTQDLKTVTPETLAELPRDLGLVFVAIPSREAELEELAALLPGGVWREVPRQPIPDQADTTLYFSYQLPAEP